MWFTRTSCNFKIRKVGFLAVRVSFTEQNAEEENRAEEEGGEAETPAEGDQSCQGADWSGQISLQLRDGGYFSIVIVIYS